MQVIDQFIAKLRQQVQLDIQQSWHDVTAADINNNLTTVDLKQWETASVNEKGYLVFPKGRQVRWLAQKLIIPPALQDYPVSRLNLRLVLTWWAEDAQIYINGELGQQGDLFDSSARVLITENAQPGQEYLVTIRLVSPNHDIGALMRSHLLYEKSDLADNIDPGLIADEVTVLFKYLAHFEPEHLDVLTAELDKFNWRNFSNGDRFVYDLAKLRSSLLPLGQNIKQRCFNLLGHAHLDMAWLWTTAETYEIAQRTFKSVLSLQQDFPNLIFGHTSPALYQWVENNRPELFEQIKKAVRLDKWEVLGGMWIEPETNLVSGESLIRQLFYGQEYYQEKFGEITKVAWLPDSFGFTWQLPQILKQCGIEYFVTGKLHWNDTNKFPLGCFWWESPDGTRLLTVMSPPNVTGVMDTNPITMANYAVDWETETGLQEIFWLPGVGDHGGGPTKDMLEVAAKWNNSPFFPEIKFSRAIDYLEKITRHNNNFIVSKSPSPQVSKSPSLQVSPSPDFPVWKDELYLELHRGCYTTHADQKKYNRYCERLLYEAELWGSFATLLCRDRFVSQPLFSNINTILEKEGLCQADWQKLIAIAWKKVLFNQFHDILPGTSITEVFTEANQDWETAIKIGENILQAAKIAIASSINLPQPPQPNAQPLVVFNSLNWERSQLITIEGSGFTVYDYQGKIVVKSQEIVNNQSIFLAENIPSVGYSLFWVCSDKNIQANHDLLKQDYILDNQYLKVIINSKNGNLDRIYDQKNQREILFKQGNELQFFQDQGQYWDAWNIDPEYQQKQLPEAKLKSITWLENNNLRQIIRVVKQFNQSEFIQDYILEINSPILKIANAVDWQETNVLVKVAFPLNLNSDYVTYEIPCGAIKRTTKPQTVEEKAKWEVSALNWADLTDNKEEYGVSLLNDSKYGYDAQPNQLRLTLLRSSLWPDPESDRGIHHFTYAIYPHKNNWQTAKTVQKGYELNTLLQTIKLEQNNLNNQEENKLPTQSKLLNLTADNLILMALKLNNNQELIIRYYEAYGELSNLEITSDLNLQVESVLDCLERTQEIQLKNIKIKPFKIVTFKLKTG
jgi:alpha-mannosidase